MAYRIIINLLCVCAVVVLSTNLKAQHYKVSPYPDLWYNDVDGARLGVRFLGEVEGTFKDGPHRIDAGVWLGSNLPTHPISYYISFTEPITTISEFGSEGNIHIQSSSRTGYAKHSLSLNKRWQHGFNEFNYVEVSLYNSYEKNFDDSYRLNPEHWSSEWKQILGTAFNFSRSIERVDFRAELSLQRILNAGFNTLTIDISNGLQLATHTSIYSRVYVHRSSSNAFGEYLGNVWTNPESNWNKNGYQRAKGTVPSTWITEGFLHFAGGANLRGYINQFSYYNSVYALNMEFSFLNPIQSIIQSSTYFSEILEFKSYVFFDIGAGDHEQFYSNSEEKPDDLVLSNTGSLADAGLGVQLSANIPDHLGKDRGLFIRYDVPFWLSSPSNNENTIKFRSVIGIGAIFNF